MTIKKINTKKHPKKYISKKNPILQYYEAASNDGATYAYIDTGLPKYQKRAWFVLEKVFGYKLKSFRTNRWYSTPEHNKRIGGASRSLHTYYGSAIDGVFIRTNGKPVPSIITAQAYQISDCPGIEIINLNTGAVHSDTRYGRGGNWKAIKKGSSYPTVSTFFTSEKPRPKYKYKGKKYYIYGARVGKLRLKISGKLKWVKVA